jgi:hypothetical protein
LPDEPVEKKDFKPLIIEESNLQDRMEDVVRDINVTFKFNQPLDPDSIPETQISITSGKLTISGKKKYNLLTRTLTFIPDSILRENLWYKLIMKKPPLSLRGGYLKENQIEILFKTGVRFSDTQTQNPPQVDFSNEIFPIFQSGCSCHSTPNPSMGLKLIFETPFEFLSEGVNTNSREWKGWKVIEPGRHERSYLLYKLLGNEKLGIEALTGSKMPPFEGEEISLESLEKIHDWIEQGAGKGM